MQDIFQAKGPPLTQAGFGAALAILGTDDPKVLWTVLAVESRGFGYLADRRPKILFERHVFHGHTEGRFSGSHPDISARRPGGYAGGAGEYPRLKRAMLLDRAAALKSASWGLGQVMGFNAAMAGFPDADGMIEQFVESEDEQLKGCVTFMANRRIAGGGGTLAGLLVRHDWLRFAKFYNGADFKVNRYDEKLDAAFKGFARSGVPGIEVRHAQACLVRLGFDPKGIDGFAGRGMAAALAAFRKQHAVPGDPNAKLDDATAEALNKAAGLE